MAIRAKSGLTIPSAVKAPAKGANIRSKSAAGGPTELVMIRVIQQQTQWCWAACTVMVGNLLSMSLDQSQLANIRLSRSDCTPDNIHCDLPSNEDQMVAVYQHPNVGITCGYSRITQGHFEANKQSLIRELEKGHPVEIGWEFHGGGRHVVIVAGHGVHNGDDLFKILDPSGMKPDFYWLTYDALDSAAGMGRWIVVLTF